MRTRLALRILGALLFFLVSLITIGALAPADTRIRQIADPWKDTAAERWRDAVSWAKGSGGDHGIETGVAGSHGHDVETEGEKKGKEPPEYAPVPSLKTPLESAMDKVIVMGRLERENTDWVAEELPDWQHAIYTVDNTSSSGLTTPRNKGREANAYLLYIIQHYHSLPATIVFLHAHRNGYPEAWHNDAANYDNVLALQTLNIPFIQTNGYANLRCNWNPGCPDEIQYLRESDDSKGDNVEHRIPEIWHRFFGAMGDVPKVIATPCCAQFAVSREQVMKRSRREYVRYHRWLVETELDDQTAGTVMEYLWHVIFGREPV